MTADRKHPPAIIETPLQVGSHRQPLQGKSQTPGGDLYNLWREQSNFLGIVDEDAIGAIFLLDKCRQGLQVGAFCCHPKFDFDRDSMTPEAPVENLKRHQATLAPLYKKSLAIQSFL